MSAARSLLTLAPLATGGVVLAYYHLGNVPRETRIALTIVAWVGALGTVLGTLIMLPDLIETLANRREKYHSAWQWFLAIPSEARVLMLSVSVGAVLAGYGYITRTRGGASTNQGPKQGNNRDSYQRQSPWMNRIRDFYGERWEPVGIVLREISILWCLCAVIWALESVREKMGGRRLFGDADMPPAVGSGNSLVELYWLLYVISLLPVIFWALLGPFFVVFLCFLATVEAECNRHTELFVSDLMKYSLILNFCVWVAAVLLANSLVIIIGTMIG